TEFMSYALTLNIFTTASATACPGSSRIIYSALPAASLAPPASSGAVAAGVIAPEPAPRSLLYVPPLQAVSGRGQKRRRQRRDDEDRQPWKRARLEQRPPRHLHVHGPLAPGGHERRYREERRGHGGRHTGFDGIINAGGDQQRQAVHENAAGQGRHQPGVKR